MSLHTLAQQLQSAGRGEDKVLVHMTPGEVNGLQSLAMAHGGSLSINPETGLPEAGFLKAILPMIAGAALAPLTAGTSLAFLGSPLGAAALVGGGTMLAGGSLKEGLMAGLGAYSGAGLGAGLSSMGTAGTQGSGLAVNANSVPLGATTTPSAPVFPNPVTTAGGTSATPVFDITKSMTQAGMPTGVTSVSGGNITNLASQAYTPMTPGAYEVAAGRVPELTGLRFTSTPLASGSGTMQATNLAYGQPSGVGLNLPAPPLSDSIALTPSAPPQSALSKMGGGLKQLGQQGGLGRLHAAAGEAAPYYLPAGLGALAMGAMGDMGQKGIKPKEDDSLIRPYEFTREQRPEAYDVGAPIYSATPGSSRERLFFDDKFTALTPYRAPGPEYKAAGGVVGLAVGGPVEQMAALNSIGANTGYPMANIDTPMYSNPTIQRPEATNVLAPSADAGVGTYTGEPRFAAGGISHLGDYSDGGRLLKGPGDGVSDSIPAVIGNKQPARLADGEFVVPARIVSELGNGSTEAGARKLYAMMDRVQKARRKTVGKDKVAANTRADKFLPA